jgi:hypothetical protein
MSKSEKRAIKQLKRFGKELEMADQEEWKDRLLTNEVLYPIIGRDRSWGPWRWRLYAEDGESVSLVRSGWRLSEASAMKRVLLELDLMEQQRRGEQWDES